MQRECAADVGARGRNTEVLTFAGVKISRAEVYFGWSEPQRRG